MPTVGEWAGRTDINFGEAGGQAHLRQLPPAAASCSSAQQLESDPPAHDELLFITIHQVYELWFQQLLHEAETARDAMRDGQTWWAKHLLDRMHVIERILVEQIDVLETMTPQDFLAFRQLLSPASGFQSVQFRELEFLSGAKDPSFVRRFKGLTDDERSRLQRRLDEPTLWDAFLELMPGQGLGRGDDDVEVSRVAADRRARPGGALRRLGARRGPAPARRAGGRLAGPARHHGRADDRQQDRHRRARPAAATCAPGCRCATTRCCGTCAPSCDRAALSRPKVLTAVVPVRGLISGCRTTACDHGCSSTRAEAATRRARLARTGLWPMHSKLDDAKQELLAEAAKLAEHRRAVRAGGVPDARQTRCCSTPTTRHVAPEDLLERSPVDVYGAAVSHYRLAGDAPAGYGDRARLHPDASTRTSGRPRATRVVEVVTDDMPFLVDSLSHGAQPAGPHAPLGDPPAAARAP